MSSYNIIVHDARTFGCEAPMYYDPDTQAYFCMACNEPVTTHPGGFGGSTGGVAWRWLQEGERDEYSDVLEIMES